MAHSKKFLRIIAELGCCLCLRNGHPDTPAEAHHVRNGGRRDTSPVIPLCMEHHRGATGVHNLGSRGFTEFHGISEEELLDRLEFRK